MPAKISFQDCENLIYQWFAQFICEWAGIGMPACNIWLATLNDHTFDEELDKKIIGKIKEIHSCDEMIYMFDGHTPLILLAVFVLFNGDNHAR